MPAVGKLPHSVGFDIFAGDETTVITVTLMLGKNDGLRFGQAFSVIDSRHG